MTANRAEAQVQMWRIEEIEMTLQELIVEMGETPHPYSGRGMMGKECLGVTVEYMPQFLFDLGNAVGVENSELYDCEQGIPLPSIIRVDSMGLESVVYFPAIPFEVAKWLIRRNHLMSWVSMNDYGSLASNTNHTVYYQK
jgi:hypothetical protein